MVTRARPDAAQDMAVASAFSGTAGFQPGTVGRQGGTHLVAGAPRDEAPSSRRGIVYLIGAGPGDPDLITRKGLRLLRAADVVVYDRLIAPELLDEARPDALRIFVGKAAGHHTLPQRDINTLLVEQARRGRVVARLKGGDPFVFGRGGEEAAALAAAGLPFEVVPGVSSAVAVPAYAGIPVTQRGHAPLVSIVTGHDEGACGAPSVDWEALAHTGGTLVIMMGVAALPRLTRRLLDGGLAPGTPAAVIEQGTTPQQRVVSGSLDTIAARAAAAGLGAPAITVIGAVAALRETLDWFEPAQVVCRGVAHTPSSQYGRMRYAPTEEETSGFCDYRAV